MKTSYFAKIRKILKENQSADIVAISRTTPAGYNGKTAPELFPSAKLLSDYKNNLINEEEYTVRYKNEVLLKLDLNEIYNKYKNSILICWEGTGKFCHRRIIADEIKTQLGISVEEYI